MILPQGYVYSPALYYKIIWRDLDDLDISTEYLTGPIIDDIILIRFSEQEVVSNLNVSQNMGENPVDSTTSSFE